jgi:hypothetical protein
VYPLDRGLGGPYSLDAVKKRKIHATRESSPSCSAYSLVIKLIELLRFILYIGLCLISEVLVCVVKKFNI